MPAAPSTALSTAMKPRSRRRGLALRSSAFPDGTPLNHFFAWNEATRRRDRRYVIACDLYALITALGGGDAADQAAAAHLCVWPATSARHRHDPLVSNAGGIAALAVAQETVRCLIASVGSTDIETHAALFAAFERLANEIDLDALARRRPHRVPSRRRPSPRRILIIRLSALGDFVQALGPIAAIRHYHRDDHISLLTTAALADFAGQIGHFDDVIIDRRPRPFALGGWLALRRRLRAGRFDRVYDLQTSQRSAAYAALFRPGPTPEWSGVARGCSHPHANLDRDRQHTIEKQSEQLLMGGIYPTPLPLLPHLDCALPQSLVGRRFVLVVPGSSPRHPAKRWPARRFGLLAEALHASGYTSVVIGAAGERALAAAIREVCPSAIDLTGRTAIVEVAALAERAVLTIGNDTGVTHLAAAAGCPVVVLFSGATDPDWCAPRGRLVRVLALGDLDELGVDRVLAEVRRTLAQSVSLANGLRQDPVRETTASGGCG